MADIGFKRMGPERVASLLVVGRYGEFGEHLERLRSWLRERGVEPVGPPLGAFQSRPPAEAGDRCRYEVQIPVAAELEGNQGVEVKTLPLGDYVTLAYPRPPGPGEASRAYEEMVQWAAARGLVPAGPPREVRLGGQERQEGNGAAELQVPVRPARAAKARPPRKELAPESQVLGRTGPARPE